MTRWYAILVKEFRQILRDPLSLGLLLAVPALLLMLYGYALSFDVQHIRVAVRDEDASPASRELLDNLFQNPYFDRAGNLDRRADADTWLKHGWARVALVVPRGYARALQDGRDVRVQALIDGMDPTAAGVAVGYLDALADRLTLRRAAGSGAASAGPPLQLEPRIWFNPELKSAHFLVPGLIGLLMMLAAVIATSLSIVREKERETMEQLYVSPLRTEELILGKIVPYVLICLVTMVIVLALGYLLFGVAIRGSYLPLAVSALLFLFAALGMGLLISACTRTQQTAFQVATIASLLPSIALSGLIFPTSSMPALVQGVTLLVAPRYFVAALRAVIVKGASWPAIWPDLAGLLALGLLFNLLAALALRRE